MECPRPWLRLSILGGGGHSRVCLSVVVAGTCVLAASWDTGILFWLSLGYLGVVGMRIKRGQPRAAAGSLGFFLAPTPLPCLPLACHLSYRVLEAVVVSLFSEASSRALSYRPTQY